MTVAGRMAMLITSVYTSVMPLPPGSIAGRKSLLIGVGAHVNPKVLDLLHRQRALPRRHCALADRGAAPGARRRGRQGRGEAPQAARAAGVGRAPAVLASADALAGLNRFPGACSALRSRCPVGCGGGSATAAAFSES